MFKRLTIVLLVFTMSGCAYNSRNLFTLDGNNMTFGYGLISVKNVNRIIMLRETNMGEGEAKYNIPDMGQYMCPVEPNTESREKDILEMNEIKPLEPINP